MTQPSLTYGHAYLDDCDDASIYGEFTSGLGAGEYSKTILHGDILELEIKPGDAADEFYRVAKTGLNINTNVYTHYILRYKTSASSDGAGAKVILNFTVGSQTVVGDPYPEYSTTWKVVEGTITAGKTIDAIYFYADDHPNNGTPGTYQVYYDFILICQNVFTFPHCDRVDVQLENRYANIEIPGRIGDITQYMGAVNPTVKLSGQMKLGTSASWGVPPLEYLIKIWQNAHKEAWQWFSKGDLADADRMLNCKVTLRRLPYFEDANGVRTWTVELTLYSLSGGQEDTWADMQWLGI